MNVIVDYDACEANGVCEGFAPDIFHLDEEDQLHVLAQPDEDSADRVRQAVRACPKVALSLTETAAESPDDR
ncbi:ferredoxin [Haloechinothrix halophila]|uniref:ferredoxin n=1 Tax=Haloechinothrix halophila TaxID=1069073 RepID=UPI000420530E|nr:ferredoxin [Haloechinothrix halophila]